MKSLVALITLVVVAAAGPARAQEMIEVPNAPPPAQRQPTLLEQKKDQAKTMLFGGLVMLGIGLGIEAGAAVYAVDNPCALPAACLFAPPHGGEVATFVALGVSGILGIGGGITLTVFGGTRLRKLHRPIALRSTGTSVSLSGRF